LTSTNTFSILILNLQLNSTFKIKIKNNYEYFSDFFGSRIFMYIMFEYLKQKRRVEIFSLWVPEQRSQILPPPRPIRQLLHWTHPTGPLRPPVAPVSLAPKKGRGRGPRGIHLLEIPAPAPGVGNTPPSRSRTPHT